MSEHVPVLLDETVEQLAVRGSGDYVDGTFGRGGHSSAILARLEPTGSLCVFDRDPQALEVAGELAANDARVSVFHSSFGDIREVLMAESGCGAVDGILLDLGVSSPQLDDADRGFSFMRDGPLDMRLDPTSGQSAAEWLNTAEEGEIARVISRYGEEPAARRIARAICQARDEQELTSTVQLATVIEQATGPGKKGRHPATRSFQGIRIFINQELAELERFLDTALDCLKPGGRLCVISFHSLEDRMVKRYLRDQSRVDPALSRLPRIPDSAKPRMRLPCRAIRASDAEVAANPRARSATLRVGEVLA